MGVPPGSVVVCAVVTSMPVSRLVLTDQDEPEALNGLPVASVV